MMSNVIVQIGWTLTRVGKGKTENGSETQITEVSLRSGDKPSLNRGKVNGMRTVDRYVVSHRL